MSPADEELSDDDEEVDSSNNDGGSLQSERTDKDEEAYDSESPASADTNAEFKMLEIASWQKKKPTNLWRCSFSHSDVEWHNEGGHSSCNSATYSGSNLEAHMLHPLPLFPFFFFFSTPPL